jgi:hypothetical protein
LLLGSRVTQANLAAKIPGTDAVIFYGHGEPDRLFGQPTGWLVERQHVLVDIASIPMLQCRPLYAVSCHALRVLGTACGKTMPPTRFVGYEVPFSFAYRHTESFRDVVNFSAVNFATNTAHSTIVGVLKGQWQALADQFLNPANPLSRSRDAFLAGMAASTNALWVGSRP